MPASEPHESDDAAPEPEQHMSRAERRAAARGKTVHDNPHAHNGGKLHGPHGGPPARKQFSNRRSGS